MRLLNPSLTVGALIGAPTVREGFPARAQYYAVGALAVTSGSRTGLPGDEPVAAVAPVPPSATAATSIRGEPFQTDVIATFG